MVKNETKILDIYRIKDEKQLNIKKVVIVVLLFFTTIMLFSTLKREIWILKQKKDFEQYEIQANLLKQQEEEKQAKLLKEKEEERLRKMPKLTQKRKR